MTMLQPTTLCGAQARLVPLRTDHTDALWEAGQAPEIWSYFPILMRSRADMERFVSEALADQRAGTAQVFAIEDQAHSNRIVGSTRLLDFVPAHRQGEVGATWLCPDVWRTRINTECKYLLLSYLFEELHLLRVQLKTDGRNRRSQRAIERIGAIYEGTLRRHRILPDGFVRDSAMYSIIDSEWPAVKQRLESLLRN